MCIALVLCSVPTSAAQDLAPGADTVTLGLLGQGTDWETPYRRITSTHTGPTVVLLGGVHGNEPAGALAAEQIAGWRIARGTLIVVPRANVRALHVGKRRTPGVDAQSSDLNRQFPAQAKPRTALARALWSLVEESSPDVLVDLHEGYDFHRKNRDSVGSSVIASDDEASRALGAALVAAIDAEISDPSKRFSLLGPPVAGSLARAAHERLGISALIVETTTKGQAATFRARQQRLLAHRLLVELDMAAHGPDVLIGSAGDDGDVAVALYVSGGVGGVGPERLTNLLDESRGFDLRRVCATDIRRGVLDQFDVVIFPGGSGSGQARQLQVEGRAAVRAFVVKGGGYVGLCAGAYLASTGYDWSLAILDAVVVDRAHWARGQGAVELAWTPRGIASALPPEPRHTVRYANGPLYAPAGDDTIPDYETWAVYESEVNTNGAPAGIMLGTPAIVCGAYGRGRVLGVSPHPEQTAGCDGLVQRLVLHAAARGLEDD